MKEKTTRARKYSKAALKKISALAHKEPRIYEEIAQRMEKKSGQPFYRQEVSSWLSGDEAKRIEPRLGAGLLLLEISNEILNERFYDVPQNHKVTVPKIGRANT